MDLYIVTGYSGAGKTIALRALEDIGFFCVDNLPRELLDNYLSAIQETKKSDKIALGVDARSGATLVDMVSYIRLWKSQKDIRVKVIFLSASIPTLIKRFAETRRTHPLSNQQDLAQAIESETSLLAPIRHCADIIIETDNLISHELRAVVRNVSDDIGRHMTVTLMSFGFKYGLPLESNFIYDVRFLPNPYFIPELSALSGLDNAIDQYLFSHVQVTEYWDKLIDFVTFTLNKAYQEGHSLITIAIGCTGGRHRSVAIVQRLSRLKLNSYTFIVKHRDIAKELA